MDQNPESKNGQPPRKTILIIDDDVVIHELFTLFMENEPVDLIHDYDGQDISRCLEANKPDLILLDIGLPGMDGRDICRHIKTGARTGSIPVIMVTGNDESCIREEGSEFGPDDFIAKPSSRQVVMRTLFKHLHWSGKEFRQNVGK